MRSRRKRWFWTPRFVAEKDAADFGYPFSNCTYLRPTTMWPMFVEFRSSSPESKLTWRKRKKEERREGGNYSDVLPALRPKAARRDSNCNLTSCEAQWL